jgi:hypothetical protein
VGLVAAEVVLVGETTSTLPAALLAIGTITATKAQVEIIVQ